MEAVEITSLMIYRLTQVLECMNVEFIVAPYEADAQLTYLFKNRKIDLVITEDSDLLAYGVTKVFFKMDPNGKGIEIDLQNLSQCEQFKMPISKGGKVFDHNMLLSTCILSGCDYCESIKGIGFKTALKLMKEHDANIKAILRHLENEKFEIRDTYL